MRVDGERLYRHLAELGEIGGYTDPVSGLRGVRRLALSPEDEAGREQVMSWMRDLGLVVRVDPIGNVYGRRAGSGDSLAPVMVGSHLDTVTTSGRFDGALGILAGLELVKVLNDAGAQTKRPVVVACFTDGEGGRFESDSLGSAVATGRIPLEEAWSLTDRDGITLRDALEAAECAGEGAVQLEPPHAFLELHVEQGPLLRAHGMDVGVVTGIQAFAWHELTLSGQSAPAGTTPMGLRRDAGVAAAKINLELRQMVASGEYGQLRATMGGVRLEPSLVNVVPGRCLATVDLRNPSDADMEHAVHDVKEAYQRIAGEEGVELSWRPIGGAGAASFDPDLQAQIASAAAALGLRHEPILSGAGHDAQELARICPAAMIFVPGEHEGISHNPRELSTQEQCTRGAQVLLDVVRALADSDP
jgi:N-carbamoyl-L-amino-acid hydrolase